MLLLKNERKFLFSQCCTISSKSLYVILAVLKMPGFSFCPISNARLFLRMCRHTYARETKAENDREENKEREHGWMNEWGIKWEKYLQRGMRYKGCRRKGENRKMCYGNQLYSVCFYLLHQRRQKMDVLVSLSNFYKNDPILISLFNITFPKKQPTKTLDARTFNDPRSLLALKN